MLMINFADPFSVLVAVILYLLILLLGKETKKSAFMAITLFAFLGILCMHAFSYLSVGSDAELILSDLTKSMIFDFVFIFLSFISYLWLDDIETRVNNKKSIDNSLDWFWSKV